jgi:hypothetical protein
LLDYTIFFLLQTGKNSFVGRILLELRTGAMWLIEDEEKNVHR